MHFECLSIIIHYLFDFINSNKYGTKIMHPMIAAAIADTRTAPAAVSFAIFANGFSP